MPRDILSGKGNRPSSHRQMAFAGVALIELRGAGKSTLGKCLADQVGWSFIELNKEIERRNGLSVAEVVIVALTGPPWSLKIPQAFLYPFYPKD